MPDHLGGFIPGGDPWTDCRRLWDWLIDVLGVKTALDIGCGDGAGFVAWMGDRGVQVLGIEGVPQADARIVQHDYTTGPYKPAGRFDLGWCCEFVEHVDEAYVENFLTTFRACDLLLLTHAFPGQGGHHHVNCRPPEYWLERLAPDFELADVLTNMTRALAESDKPNHYVRSGLALRRR